MIKSFENYTTYKLTEFIDYIIKFIKRNNILNGKDFISNSFTNAFFIENLGNGVLFEFTIKEIDFEINDYIYIWNQKGNYVALTSYISYKIESLFGEFKIDEGDTIKSVKCDDYIKLCNMKLDSKEYETFKEAERFGL